LKTLHNKLNRMKGKIAGAVGVSRT